MSDCLAGTPLPRLIGDILPQTDDPGYRWFGSTFTRVVGEVGGSGTVTHFVRYQSAHAQFAGVEVEQGTATPEGLLAWELREDGWTVRRASGEILWQAPLSWQWQTGPAGHWLGEFTAACPGEWGGGRQAFVLTANSYLRRGEWCDDAVSLVEPDPTWPRQYAAFATWLREALGTAVALHIEHYGSTAIPGIPAKPIIDVLVEVPSFDVARRRILPLLNREEWEYWWYHDHMVFIKRQAPMGRRTHHLHLAPAGHRLWEGIAFRDYLIAHPETAAAYAALKRELAGKYRGDREGYTDAKAVFVRKVTTQALERGYSQ